MPFQPPYHRPPGWKTLRERARDYDKARGTSLERGYDGAWRKLRAQFLAENLTCCEAGCSEPATDVDHRISIRERPDLRLTWSNLRAYCHAHHSRRTAIEQGFAQRGGRPTP
jgi:5-methylcytosine-specific restriction endonuclease McrA